MENKYIQPLLRSGLLELGDSDERLSHIEQSIADLATKLSQQPALLREYTLVALDPEVPSENKVLADAEEIVADKWKALRSKFPDRPVQILRAVILHALYNVGVADPALARVIYLTAANFYPYAKLTKDKQIVADILGELGDIAEEHAAQEWSFAEEAPTLALDEFTIDDLEIQEIVPDKAALRAALYSAVKNPQGYNPTSHIEQWANHFADNASNGIAAVVSQGVSQVEKAMDMDAISAPINEYMSKFQEDLNQVLKSNHASVRAVERRSKLLWWKQTFYSPSLKNGYRSIAHSLQPIIMAADLVKQLPPVSPVSVEFLLRDTTISLNSEAVNKINFSELLRIVNEDAAKKLLSPYLKHAVFQAERLTITNFLGRLVHGSISPGAFRQSTGIADTEQLSLDDLGVIILRDLLTNRLVN